MSDRRPPACDDCGPGTMVWGERLRGWYCVNCDQSEMDAINARDEELADAERCDECDRVGEFLCDVHGPLF